MGILYVRDWDRVQTCASGGSSLVTRLMALSMASVGLFTGDVVDCKCSCEKKPESKEMSKAGGGVV